MQSRELITTILSNDVLIDFLDIKFIDTMLYFKSENQKKAILSEYRDVYMKAYNNEPIEYKKSSKGRYMANTWLRELISNK